MFTDHDRIHNLLGTFTKIKKWDEITILFEYQFRISFYS